MNEPASLLYNFTGNGKGKTSAALGMVLRALGHHWRVAMLQFQKGAFETGERRFFAEHFPEMRVQQLGLGLTSRPGDHAGTAREGWKVAAEMLRNFDGELLVLDELNVSVSLGFLNPAEVADALKNRRLGLNVVITGRNSPPELIAVSDLVSEITEEKHPFRQGIPARKGLDF